LVGPNTLIVVIDCYAENPFGSFLSNYIVIELLANPFGTKSLGLRGRSFFGRRRILLSDYLVAECDALITDKNSIRTSDEAFDVRLGFTAKRTLVVVLSRP
tara:strand:+ start:57 stop:359 length:303 start_codon:yes stop_codon:yes gene_type:complete